MTLGQPVRPELLARLPAGVSDAEVEREAGIPQGFLQRARHGGGAGPRAAQSWLRLGAWIDRPRSPAAAVTAAPVLTPTALAGLIGGQEVTLERLSAAVVHVAELVARPDTDPARLSLLLAALRELRPIHDRLEEQRARVDARRPVRIRVVYQNSWRRKLADVEERERRPPDQAS